MYNVYKYGYREFYQRKSINSDFSITDNEGKNSNLKKIPDFPLVIHIETTSYCDNNCFFCTRREKIEKINICLNIYLKK